MQREPFLTEWKDYFSPKEPILRTTGGWDRIGVAPLSPVPYAYKNRSMQFSS